MEEPDDSAEASDEEQAVTDLWDTDQPVDEEDWSTADEPLADEDWATSDEVAARYGPLESVIRKPRAALIPLIVCVSVAVLLGLSRAPVFTAEAQLVVGGVVRNNAPAAGQTDAIKSLTDVYSRLVGNADLAKLVNDALGSDVPPGSLSAAPIPDSPVIRLDATASNAQDAIDRANAGADQLSAYVAELKANAASGDDKLLDQLNTAEDDFARKKTIRDQRQGELATAEAGSSTPALVSAQAAFAEAEAAANVAGAKAQVLRDNYSAAASARSAGIDLSIFSKADVATSDRSKTLILYVFIGLVLGGLLGMACATLVANDWELLPRERRPQTD